VRSRGSSWMNVSAAICVAVIMAACDRSNGKEVIFAEYPDVVRMELRPYPESSVFSFSITNVLGTELRLLGTSSDCQCTSVSLSNEKIGPGGTVMVWGSVTTGSDRLYKGLVNVVTDRGAVRVSLIGLPQRREFWAKDVVEVKDVPLGDVRFVRVGFACLERTDGSFGIEAGVAPKFLSAEQEVCEVVSVEEVAAGGVWAEKGREFVVLLRIRAGEMMVDRWYGVAVDAVDSAGTVLDSLEVRCRAERQIRVDEKVAAGSSDGGWLIHAVAASGLVPCEVSVMDIDGRAVMCEVERLSVDNGWSGIEIHIPAVSEWLETGMMVVVSVKCGDYSVQEPAFLSAL